MNPTSRKPGYFEELSKAIKDKVSIPVVLTGGIVDAETAEMLLKQEKTDLIGVGRAILKDSQWAKTAMVKRQADAAFPEYLKNTEMA